MTASGEVMRQTIASARRIVVKVGSSSLTSRAGGLDRERVAALAAVLAARHASTEVVLVSSGAIAAGLAPLGLPRRPADLASAQAAASVGQGLLMSAYHDSFAHFDITVGQVLLTADDIARRAHYRNARQALLRLLALRVIPIINENDTVATAEITVGDNDRLAALVTHLVEAQALIMLSDVDALYDSDPTRGGRRVPVVTEPSRLSGLQIGGSGSAGVGRGGMRTKVAAAAIAGAAGIPVLLAGSGDAAAALDGQDVGTVFCPPVANRVRRSPRTLWLEHASDPVGRLWCDDGAVEALQHRGASLLPAGVVRVEGRFLAGDAVDVCTTAGVSIARGLVGFDSGEIPPMLGRSMQQVAEQRGAAGLRVLIHRDDLVLLGEPPTLGV